VTITEVAERAGVSMKTVSRVLNAEPHVREEVRERVLEAVRELHYRPKVSARSLAGSRSYVIGYLLGDPSIAYTGQAQIGALAACRRAGYHLLVEALDPASPDLAGELEPLFSTLTVDGVLLTPPHCDNRVILDALDRAGAPYARIAPSFETGRSPHVEADDRRAARDMTDYLLSLGHERIAFIAGHAEHSATHRRMEGYHDALAGRGLEIDEALVVPGDFTFASGYAAAGRLLSLRRPPTAIFASNDDMAAAALAVAHEKGLKAPQELSIAGFDDSPTAGMVWPRLTTVRQPIADMAAAATEMLIAGASKAAAPAAQTGRLFHCELVIRGSTAPPGAGGN
jgi:LacI family transcriptional regulator